MNSKVSDPNIYDPSLGSNTTVIDKETQTSTVSVKLMSSDKTPSNSPPKKTDTTCKDNDNIKVFEFCELVKDPQDDTVSIVKETFTEEVISDPESSIFGKPTHNRYKYCREVIQPFCKAHTTACPKYPIHREIPFKKSLPNTSKDSQTLVNTDSCTIIMGPDEKKTTFENPSRTPSNLSIEKDGKKRPCPPTLPINTKKECQQEATNCEPYSKCPQYKDESKLKEYLSSCVSTTITMAKKASATCLEKCQKTIGIIPPKCGEEKPTYYVLKKPKSQESIVDKNSYDSILDADIVQNFKSGVKGIVDTVINKTKETVNIFSSSCKELNAEKDTKTKDCDGKSLTMVTSILPNTFKSQEDSAEASQSGTLTKIKSALTNTFKGQDKTNESSSLTKMLPNPFKSKEDNAGSTKNSFTKITSIFTNKFGSKEDSDSEHKSLTKIKSIISNTFTKNEDHATNVKDNINVSKIVEPAIAAIESVASAVSLTASKAMSKAKDIKESLSMTNIINSRLEKSSPEDDPNIIRTKSPENISHEHDHSHEPDDTNPSMFTMLKTKLLSMFADNDEDDDDESEDEDENFVEKIFDKHCYQ